MSKITLIYESCADQNVDALVNAANKGLWAGGSICGVIFRKAGLFALTAAYAKHKTPLKDGSTVITPAFKLSKALFNIAYIISFTTVLCRNSKSFSINTKNLFYD